MWFVVAGGRVSPYKPAGLKGDLILVVHYKYKKIIFFSVLFASQSCLVHFHIMYFPSSWLTIRFYRLFHV